MTPSRRRLLQGALALASVPAWLALPSETGLLLQPGEGGETLEAELQARLFRFNHDGSLLAVLTAGTNQLQIIELPVQAE